MPLTAVLRVLLVLMMLYQAVSAQVMDYLYDSWRRYETECQQNMSMEPPPTGLVCNRTFDKYSCWPDALPNTTVNVSCPWFLPWYKKVQHGYVYKHCGPDGQWAARVNGHPLRDAQECQLDLTDLKDQERFAKTYESFKIMYTVGYSMSVGALVLALAILVGFSKLHCMRNYIHINLFISFILRGVSVLVIDAMLKTRYSEKIDEEYVHVWLSSKAGCRAAFVLMQYGIIANYCWLLVEGIYLRNLLVLAVFSERSHFALYVCIGWGEYRGHAEDQWRCVLQYLNVTIIRISVRRVLRPFIWVNIVIRKTKDNITTVLLAVGNTGGVEVYLLVVVERSTYWC